MQRLSLVIVVAVLAAGLSSLGAQTAPPADKLFATAQHKETVDGDLKGAVEIYAQVVQRAGGNRALAAQALLRMAECYEKLGDSKGPAAYERVVREFGDQHEAFAIARAKLEALAPNKQFPFEIVATDRNLGNLSVARVSPDGTFAIGTRLVERDLYVRDLRNGIGRTLFARPGGWTATEWMVSPDSQHAAAIVRENAPRDQSLRMLRGEMAAADVMLGTDIVVVNTAPGDNQPTVLHTPPTPSDAFGGNTSGIRWSPNGKLLAYVVASTPPGTYEVWVLTVASGESRRLDLTVRGNPNLVWSDGGNELAALPSSSATGAIEIQTQSLETGALRRITLSSADGSVTIPGLWTTRGELFVRQANWTTQHQETLLVDLGTGHSRTTCVVSSSDGDGCLDVTRDGASQLVWKRATRQLMIRNTATDADRPLTLGSGEELDGQLSPDDRMVVFQSNRDGRWGLYGALLASAPTSDPVRIAWLNDSSPFDRFQWTAGGFVARWSVNESNIIRVNVDPRTGRATSPPERLTQDGVLNNSPAISTDGESIAYWSQQGTRRGVALMDSNGANERLVLAPRELDYWGLRPSWRSSDELLFTGYGPGDPASRQLFAVNPRTGALSSAVAFPELRPFPATPQPRLVPSLDAIVYFDEESRTFRARSQTDRSSRVLVAMRPQEYVTRFEVSPDGRRIAYLLATKTVTGSGCLQPCEFGVLTIQTGERRIVASLSGAQTPAAWSPDGRFLVCGTGSPLVLDTETGRVWPLLNGPSPVASLNWDGEASWSPDGSFIVLTMSLPYSNWKTEWRQWHGVTADTVAKAMTTKGGGR